MFFLRFTSLIFIVFTSVYSVSQDKCEMTIGSVIRYNFSVNMLEMRIEHLSRTHDQTIEVSRRLEQIITRLDRIWENSTDQLDDEGATNIKKIQAFIQSSFSVINEFLSQYRELLLFIRNLRKRENTALNRMDKLRFFDRQNKKTLGRSYLSFYYENLDEITSTYESIKELKQKLLSMRKELKRVEKWLNQLER